ncbi:MAG: alpha-ketoglutarate-dependent dioxygenase AlkB [Bacteriovoracaceae bacterium]|nr:alpha-ketoglutarate-dependent dioxygenase AlkB [Bacteriovoracaceae bacterium]
MQQSSLFPVSSESIINTNECRVELFRGFISNHQNYFFQLVEGLAWQQDQITLYGKTHNVPRLQAWYGDPGMEYTYSGIHLMPNNWTLELKELKEKIESYTAQKFNSVLCNFYRSGSDYVAWHSDNESELGPNPFIASLSFGEERKFILREKDNKVSKVELLLGSGDLLLMSDKTQEVYEHQISKTKKVTEGRINLTFRQIIRS